MKANAPTTIIRSFRFTPQVLDFLAELGAREKRSVNNMAQVLLDQAREDHERGQALGRRTKH
jgi:hypothetical protein